jgi:hypothetical protein
MIDTTLAWQAFSADPRFNTADQQGAFAQAIVAQELWDQEFIDLAYRHYNNGIELEHKSPQESFREALCCASKKVHSTN